MDKETKKKISDICAVIVLVLVVLALVGVSFLASMLNSIHNQDNIQRAYTQGYIQGQRDFQDGNINIATRPHENVWILKDGTELPPLEYKD